MDYEKKYNEALERAKATIDIAADKDLVKGVATTIFPELRESEDFDEEVRKWLVGYFSSIKDTVWIHRNTITCEQILEWLEKQKEQKQTDFPAGFYVTMPDGKKYYTKEMRCNGMNVKVVEPKPAEWSEEDAVILNCCISSIEEAKENRYAYKETDGDTSYDHEIAWLKSLRPSWKPSEEQMEALRNAFHKLANTDVADSVRLSIMYDNLKKL